MSDIPQLTDDEKAKIREAVIIAQEGAMSMGVGYTDEDESAIQQRVVVARRRLNERNPFLGAVSNRLVIQHASYPCTFATDGIYQYYDQSYVSSVDEETIVYGLANNAMHLVFDHLNRRGDRHNRIWNIANDILVNDLLIKEGFKPVEKSITDPRFSADTHTSEEVYDIIYPEYMAGKLSLFVDGVPTKVDNMDQAVELGVEGIFTNLIQDAASANKAESEMLDAVDDSRPAQEEIDQALISTKKAVENLRGNDAMARFAPDASVKG